MRSSFCSKVQENFRFLFLELATLSRSDSCVTSSYWGLWLAVCLVPSVFPGPQLTGPLFDPPPHCPRFPRFLSWHIYLVLFVNGHLLVLIVFTLQMITRHSVFPGPQLTGPLFDPPPPLS